MTHEDHGLGPEERARFAALQRERQPPPELEDQLVGALMQRGLVRPRRPRPVLAVAIGIALLILGFVLGVWQRQPSAPEARSPVFVLLLYELNTQPKAEAELVEEYHRWALDLHQAGHLVGGAKLQDEGRILRRSGTALEIQQSRVSGDRPALSGYFLIRASSYEEALQVASTCPHLRYGGVIELRAIEKT